MVTLRRSGDRGRTQMGWLDSRHTFSFNQYHHPEHMGFGALRVINDDRVAPGGGFGTHGHRDMEILSYVLEGAIEHQDSLGNTSVLRPGELQRMTAGTGVNHSEYNPSDSEPLRFLQIWILPERRGLEPGYEQRPFPLEESRGRLLLMASPDGREGSVKVHQDVFLHAGRLDPGNSATVRLEPGRSAWIQVARGAVSFNSERLEEGDGAAIASREPLEITARNDAEVLVFDLA